jgi:hypothetical protein
VEDNAAGAVGRQPGPDDFVLYPAEKRTPYGRVYTADPSRPMAGNSVHHWWYEQACLVEKGQPSLLNMHRSRHGFAL